MGKDELNHALNEGRMSIERAFGATEEVKITDLRSTKKCANGRTRKKLSKY